MITKTEKKLPKNPNSKTNTPAFFHARNMYFRAKNIPPNNIVHNYSSKEIAQTIRSEFNIDIPESTIRRWSITPDKDFEGRTWSQEWQKRLAIGAVKAVSNPHTPEQELKNEEEGKKSIEENIKTPMQQLSELKERSLNQDIKIAINIDSLIQLAVRETMLDYEKNKKIDWDKLRSLATFHASAKNRLYSELKDIESLEKKLDSELLYGSNVSLKDPQARERVRKTVLGFMNIAYEKGKKDKQFKEQLDKELDIQAHTQEAFELKAEE